MLEDEIFERLEDRALTAMVPKVKVNSYWSFYTDDSEIFIDPDARIFRIDFFNNGSNQASIATAAGFQKGAIPSAKIDLIGRTGTYTFENHPAYSRKDNLAVYFTGGGTNNLTVVIHVLE